MKKVEVGVKGKMGKMGLVCWEVRVKRMGIWVVVVGVGVGVEEMQVVVGKLEGRNQWGRRGDGGSDGCG